MAFHEERSQWNRNRSNRVVIIGAGMVGSTYAMPC